MPLHLRQTQDRRICRGIGQGVFDRLLRFHLAPDDQVPTPRCVFLTVPQPNPPVREFDPQCPARAVAQDAAHPSRRIKPLDQAFHRDRFHRCPPLLRRTQAARPRRRNHKLGPLGPNPLGAMDIGNEHLVGVIQRPQEGGFLRAKPGGMPCRTRHRYRPIRTASPGHAPGAQYPAHARFSRSACTPLAEPRPARIGLCRRSSPSAGRAACQPGHGAVRRSARRRRDLAVVDLPSRPDHCRAMPTERSPSLGPCPWARLWRSCSRRRSGNSKACHPADDPRPG